MKNMAKAGKLVMSVPEAGQKLGISRNAAYQAAARGDIPTLKIGGRICVPIAAFERLLDVQMKQAASA